MAEIIERSNQSKDLQSRQILHKREDVAVVIRSSGERTLSLCKKMIEEQVKHENIVVIKEVPFSKAVRQSFDIGLDYKLQWTLAVDADVLLAENAINNLILLAEQESQLVFKFNARLIDKLFEYPRQVGVHLYRTKLLDIALENFPKGEFVRPETQVAEVLREKLGLSNVYYDCIIGLHDFEQWYCDIYRKGFVHARKHGDKAVEHFLKYWPTMMERDLDYKVALIGLCVGLGYKESVHIDMRTLPKNYQENRMLENLEEKSDLLYPEWKTGQDIKDYIENSVYIRSRSFLKELTFSMKYIKLFKIAPRMLAYLMRRFGENIYQWSAEG